MFLSLLHEGQKPDLVVTISPHPGHLVGTGGVYSVWMLPSPAHSLHFRYEPGMVPLPMQAGHFFATILGFLRVGVDTAAIFLYAARWACEIAFMSGSLFKRGIIF